MAQLLRRRFLRSPSPEDSREPTPDTTEEVQVVAKARLKELKDLTRQRPSRRRTTTIFLLGGLLGLFAAALFANKQEVINLQGLAELNLDSLIDVIPAGIIRDAKDLSVSGFLGFECTTNRKLTGSPLPHSSNKNDMR